MKIHALVLGLLLAAAPAFAADVDGKWSGSIDGGQGPTNVAYEFKADGTTLTGSNTGPDGTVTAIGNGKIDGNNISFTIEVDFGGMAMSIPHKGVVNAAEGQITLTLDFAGMPFDFVVRKAR